MPFTILNNSIISPLYLLYFNVKYDYTVNLAGTGDRSEYDIESY